MSEYAYDNENVKFIYVTKIDEFIEEWNNPEFKYANTIHLYLHGDMGSLYFFEETMTYEDMDKLNNKYVQNKVYLYSCNGGTEFENTNVAWKISEKIYRKYVEALKDDFVDYFSILHPFRKIPIMHNGKGTWCYFYSMNHFDNGYEYYTEEIGDEWTL